MRSGIMIAKVTAQQGLTPSVDDARFVRVCLDILESKKVFNSRAREQHTHQRKMLLSLLEHHAPSQQPARSRARKESQHEAHTKYNSDSE
ncbi:MAG: hypothetical protein HC893_15450 [Chloroflexaceae bacterium]|nr:hypothetical protein [Chloroflexaceae bacterium]